MTIGLDISVLNDKEKTGIGVYTYELINALLKINKKDQFILFGISTFKTYNFLKNIEFKKYPNVKLKIYKLPAKTFRLSFLSWQKIGFPNIENLVGSVDIFHSFNWYLPPQKGGKTVATVFDMTPIIYPKFHLEKTIQLEKVRLKRISEKADLVITISENSKKDFLKYSPKSRVEVMYPAADNINLNFKKSDIARVLRKYNLQLGYFLSVSTLEPRKNLLNVLKAYLQSNLKTPLVLVGGSGWKSGEIADLIKTNNRIRLLGYVAEDELPVLYNSAKCLIYLSFYEGFGLPVLEAMRCQTAVVSSNTSSLPEVGGGAPMYVNPQDEKGIIEKLKEIDKDKKLRGEMIKKGIKQTNKFSWEKSARKLNLLYQNLQAK